MEQKHKILPVRFSGNVKLEDTMLFESEYHENLQMDLNEKREIVERSIVVWMFLGDKLVGETYGIPTVELEDLEGSKVVDVEASEDSIYCYSTTILLPWQRKGFGKILKAFWLGMVNVAFSLVVGHAGDCLALNLLFGAKPLVERKNWYDTGKTYTYYEINLK